MKKNITLFMYSHSSYSDVWPPFFNQSEKFMPDYKKVLFTDDDKGLLPKNWKCINYNNQDSYSTRVYKCLEQIDTELCFLHHEDMFLYKNPNHELLDKYIDVVKNEDIDFIRLLRSVDNPFFAYKGIPTLYPIPKYSRYFFSVQPSICKTQSLLDIYRETKTEHIREFEPRVQKTCLDLGTKGLFHYDNEPKRGAFHYDSSVYPYVATAIVKGKWNTGDYFNELSPILKENNINVAARGEV